MITDHAAAIGTRFTRWFEHAACRDSEPGQFFDHQRDRRPTIYRTALLSAVAVAVLAGVVALVAAAWTADRCETFAGPGGHGSHTVCGPILDAYRDEHGPEGGLGPPSSDEHDPEPLPDQSPGHRQQDFDDGVIDLDLATGHTQVFRGDGFVPIT